MDSDAEIEMPSNYAEPADAFNTQDFEEMFDESNTDGIDAAEYAEYMQTAQSGDKAIHKYRVGQRQRSPSPKRSRVDLLSRGTTVSPRAPSLSEASLDASGPGAAESAETPVLPLLPPTTGQAPSQLLALIQKSAAAEPPALSSEVASSTPGAALGLQRELAHHIAPLDSSSPLSAAHRGSGRRPNEVIIIDDD